MGRRNKQPISNFQPLPAPAHELALGIIPPRQGKVAEPNVNSRAPRPPLELRNRQHAMAGGY